ncbi:MAG: glycoside hydrolase family 88 protein [Bacteroidales bacterium]|nr:glycoside hydrolase family 88 protein [Bacteroidales bacterium]
MRIKLFVLLLSIGVLCSFTAPKYDNLTSGNHPRLFMDDETFDGIKSQVAAGTNRYLKLVHDGVMPLADWAVATGEELSYKLDPSGRRILQVSQDALARIFSCAYAWRFTGEDRYLERAVKDLDAVCSFPDWNARRHFLDTGEMCAAVGIGYDWLYNDLSDTLRTAALSAIEHYAFDAALGGVWNLNFYKSRGNWNQVCNGGLAIGALAAYESMPDKAKVIIEKAVEANPLAMTLYAPDGNYPEGVNYWSYGTRYEMFMLCALESCLGTDFGLSEAPGFDKTGEYCLFTYGSSGMAYNYSDNRPGEYPLQALWYLAYKQGRPDLLWRELRFVEDGIYGTQGSEDRFLPLLPLFASKLSINRTTVPDRKLFIGCGPVPVMMVHSDMGNPNDDHYIGFKGGCPRESHSHMDNGSFVYDSQGIRWAIDIPRPEYSDLEVPIRKAGGSLWDMRQNSLRWKQRAYDNFHHNTITINGHQHRADGRAFFTEKFETEDKLGATLDMSGSFAGDAAFVLRTVTLEDGKTMRVADEISALDTLDAYVRWVMVTDAFPEITGDGFILEKEGKRVSLKFSSAGMLKPFKEIDGNVWIIGFETVVPKGSASLITAEFEDMAPLEQESMAALTGRVFLRAADNLLRLDNRLDDKSLPGSINPDGSFRKEKPTVWTSGFFPGSLWYLYEYSHDEKVKDVAWKNTLKLDPILDPELDVSHDVGFMVECSYGNAYRLTGNSHALDALRAGAAKLASRYSPAVGCIRSWSNKDPRVFRVIIDNMMNLELLMDGYERFGTDSLRSIAIRHANTTMKNHFRKDGSCYHLVIYDGESGEVTKRRTVQGFADESAWSRGQAWALYGYTMMYGKTGKKAYLRHARRIASYIIPKLPEDGVPYWDFNAPGTPDALPSDAPGCPSDYRWQPGDKIERDASAGAVMASAFVSLSRYTKCRKESEKYLKAAETILRTLSSDEYLAGPDEEYGFLLKHSVGNLHGNAGVDVPFTFADYYFLEALVRYQASMDKQFF